MKKSCQRLFLGFIFSFIGFFLFIVLTASFFASKGLPPQSWEEIYDFLWLYIIGSLIFALAMTIRAYFDPPENENNKQHSDK